jgi:hypothetical protein
VVRPLPRPAYAHDQGYRHGVQADQGGRRLLAWRQQQSGAKSRIYGTAFASQKELDEYLHMIEEAEKRDHRKIGK